MNIKTEYYITLFQEPVNETDSGLKVVKNGKLKTYSSYEEASIVISKYDKVTQEYSEIREKTSHTESSDEDEEYYIEEF